MKRNKWKKRQRRPSSPRSLRFSPYAWAKLLYLRDRGDTEIGGFGLSAPEDPLLLMDVLTVKQRCSAMAVAFDDGSVADLFDRLVDEGLSPTRFGRIWLHTHPGSSPLPSSTDEETFQRVFGRTDWSVMAIVARDNATYARLSFHVGPGGAIEVPVCVDYAQHFEGANWESWEQEYVANVSVETLPTVKLDRLWPDSLTVDRQGDFLDWEDFYGGTSRARSV